MFLPSYVKYALEKLEHAGFCAYAVGGCVRDSLLGKEPFDFDITTSALPEETKTVFAGEHIIETGIKHGTVTVLIEHHPLEITTFRVDLGYSDNRHPSSVAFTPSLKEDLARRDFTVNAMAYSEKSGIVDIFGGKSDLEHGIIRAVGDPSTRFNEDALRIMRALRFASVLGFSIEEKTSAAVHENKNLLENVSVERLSCELVKLLCGKAADAVLKEYSDVISVMIPELSVLKGYRQHHFRHDLDLLEHTAAVLMKTPPNQILRLAALFHDMGKPLCRSFDENGTAHYYGHAQKSAEIANNRLFVLKLDSQTRENVTELVLHHEDHFPAEPKCVKRMLNKLGEQRYFELLELMSADEHGKAEKYRMPDGEFMKYREIAEKIIAEKECFSLKELAVKGSDLIEIGYKPSPEMGKALTELLEAVMDGEVPNEREALLKRLSR